MRQIFILGIAAAFFGGVAIGLFVSYPIPGNTLYVCMWALSFQLVGCLLAAAAVVLHAARSQRLRLERAVDLTVDALERRRGLGVVDKGS